MTELYVELGMELAQLVGVVYIAWKVRHRAPAPSPEIEQAARAMAKRQIRQLLGDREKLRARVQAIREAQAK